MEGTRRKPKEILNEWPTEKDKDALAAILATFCTIRATLIAAGVKPTRFSKREFEVEHMDANKIHACAKWIKKFVAREIADWNKIRRENSEEIWATYARLDFGDEYPEVAAMNKAHKAVREGFLSSKANLFINERKPKDGKRQGKAKEA